MVCMCEICTYSREVRQHLADLDEASRTFFEGMYERLCLAEMDRDFNQMKREEAEKKAADASWVTNPDRSGGQFTDEEVRRHEQW